MKSLFFKISCIFVFGMLILNSCSGLQKSQKPVVAEGEPPAIIPLPQSVEWGKRMYAVPKENVICYTAGSEKTVAWLQQLLKGANIESSTTVGENCGNWNVILDSSLEAETGEEGYLLEVNNNGISLRAATEAGLFYGIQTLRQFFPAGIEQGSIAGQEQIMLRQGMIQDEPSYSWRGTMVDIARSFFDLKYLKSHVDRMALYKMNRLHLHLTDDQGWRIEIKSLPELTNIGSKGSVLNGRSGYLTQEEYLDLQNYAAARNIIIIPEIDMPGHIYSALVAYPELNCDEYSNIEPRMATPPELFTGTKVGWSKLCLTNPEIYDFVSTVIGEMASITYGPWIHIGGDEIKDDLYEEFVIKADSIVQKYGKTTIGWEEVTKAPVSSSLISQQWHGKVKSVVDNIKVIESICTNFYFDHANIPGQENTNNWCKKTGVTLEEVYNFSSSKNNVIGFEAPVWTEFVWDDNSLDNRFWPRTIAVAEIAWNHGNKNFTEFSKRLHHHRDRLERMGVNYFPVPELNWEENQNTRIKSDVFSGFISENFKRTTLFNL